MALEGRLARLENLVASIGSRLSTIANSISVTSVFGRTGAVTAATNDYSEAQISFTDVTTNDVSTTKHGYVPKAPNDAKKALVGDGTWTNLAWVELGSTSITGADAASMSVSWTGTYRLIYVWSTFASDQGSDTIAKITLNNDTGNNYYNNELRITTNTVAAFDQTPQTYIITWMKASQTAMGNGISMFVQASPAGQVKSFQCSHWGAATGAARQGMSNGYWNETSNPVTRVDVTANAGNLKVNSRIIVFGVV